MSEADRSSLAIHSLTKPAVDLRAAAIRACFADNDGDHEAAELLQALDRADRMAIDVTSASAVPAPDVQRYLDALAGVVAQAAPQLHRAPRQFAQLLAQLSTTRCMVLVAYVAQHNPQFLDSLAFLIETEEGMDPDLAAIRRRFEAFSKARLLGEIFGGKRLHRIQTIMESYTDE